MRDEHIADEGEVLRMLTGIMRGDYAEAKISERCKAAEDLGKHYGLFDPKEKKRTVRPAVVREIDRRIREMRERAKRMEE